MRTGKSHIELNKSRERNMTKLKSRINWMMIVPKIRKGLKRRRSNFIKKLKSTETKI